MTWECVASFRFYDALNDFLPAVQRQRTISYGFDGQPGIKAPIQAFGVPHPEVDLLVVNGRAVGFNYRLQANDRVAVFPLFTHLDLGPLGRLREPVGPEPRFVLDVNLGKLAKRLRLLGFDSLYRNDYRDIDVVTISADQRRVVLTRDRRLLFAKRIVHGYWVRAVHVDTQVREVLQRYARYRAIRPFRRCLVCNGLLAPVPKAAVMDRLEPKTRRYYERFHRCCDCGRIYWEGSHLQDMRQRFAAFLSPSP